MYCKVDGVEVMKFLAMTRMGGRKGRNCREEDVFVFGGAEHRGVP